MVKFKCDECSRGVRKPHLHRGKSLCYWCWLKHINIMPREVTLIQAVNKIYKVKSDNNKGICYFPPILAGMTIKIGKETREILSYKVRKKYSEGYCHLPKEMVGKRFKIKVF